MSDTTDLVPRLKESIRKVISGFCLKHGDHMVAITDPGVEDAVKEALYDVIWEMRAHTPETQIQAKFVPSLKPTGSAQSFEPEVEAEMEPATALLYLTSMSRSHCAQTREFVLNKNRRHKCARLISITNGRADTLLEGAINEDFAQMRRRITKINRLCANVERFYITSPEGTKLRVCPWTRYNVVDDGLIDQPSKLGNYPFGEGASTAVRFMGTGGIIVSNRVVGNGLGRMIEPIHMLVEGGKITTINGGDQARSLKAAMDEADAKIGDKCRLPNPSYWLAEISFGANAAAWRVEEGKNVLPPTSLEAEKAYSASDTSLHVAHGANYIFGVPKWSTAYNPVGHHTDHVLQGGITVDAYEKGGHVFRLIDRGVPVY